MSHPEDSISPVTSPFVSDNELEVAKPKEARTPKKQTPSKHSSSPLQMRSTPIRPKWHASMMKFSPSASRNPAPTPAGASANDSDDDDDDLEILPPKQSRAVRQLVNLSGLGSLSKAEIDKRRNNQKLAVDVMEKQREQILRDRHEKEEMIKKIRGEVLAEMKNSKKGDAEDEEFEREHLFEIARREAELIRKREIEAEKKKVEAVEIPSEDEEIQIDFDEEEQEDPEDDELVVPFDQEDEEFSEDEPENDKEETLIPEATVQDVKSHRRRPQILDDDEDDNNDNPFASQATQSNPDISMTQMFQQTQTALSNSQQLKIGDFSSDEDDEEVIPATQLESSTTNANNDADGSLQDESFEFRSQKKVNFDFDTDVLPTQLSQFPEPTQVNMVQRPDMMDIVEGLRRPNDTKPGLRRKNRLDEKDTPDGAATQADLGSSMTQAIPDSTEPIGLNDTTQKIFGTAPDATQKVLGTATDTQAIPFFETQVAPEPFGQLGTANPTAKEDDSADEDEEQRIYIRRHRQPKVTKGAKPKDTGAGRELADEEAVESEDEWAGMGGNSDDEMDPEIAEELKQMVDDDESSINQTKDAAALQKLFATKKRSEDQEMEGRLHDVITGDWRKKKTKGGLLDLSDDEDFVVGENDDIETQKYKRRLKKAMERRKRKLLENDKLAAMKNDPKKQSFMKIIEGENSFMDTKRYFADADSSDDELEIIETPSTEGTQEESSKAASVEPSMAMPPPALPKRAGSVTTATAGQPPAKKRRSEVEYIRQTLSFLDEDKSDGFENQDSEVPGGGWDPSRTLGDAIDPEQLISDDEDDDAMFMQEEAPLGEPSAAQHRSTRVVNLIQERRSLTISSMTSSSSTSAIEILDDNEQISATAAGDDDNDDDDDDEVIFKCTKFQSSATSIRRARHQENSKGFSDVVVGSMLAGVGSKSSINYKKRRLGGGAGPGSEAAAAQNRVTRMRFEAVDKVIASRKQSSVLLSRKSGGSWMEE